NITPREPFPLFGVSTLASIVAFLLTAIWLVIRQLRSPTASRARAVPAGGQRTPSNAAAASSSSPQPEASPATVRNTPDESDTAPLP
ncbi:MAG TPA: hypothetical protein VKQ36_10190, partial [Ktedonobacterales bacterium]|nr:hypothetical protein [Ktedonobacterales bacterium]